MRMLFSTWAWPTHYLPMVPLAWAARAAGHEVRVASQPALADTIARSGMTGTLVGRDLDITEPFRREIFAVLDRDWNTITPADIQRMGERATAMFMDLADAMVDDLVAFARAWRPDVIVYDPLTYAAPLAAAVVGVPAVRHLFGPDQPPTAFEHAGLRPLLDRYGLDGLDTLGALTVDPCPPSLSLPGPENRQHTRYIPYNGPGIVPAWLREPPDRPRICVSWGTSTVKFCGAHHYLAGDLALAARELDAEIVVAVSAADRPLLGELPDDVRVVEALPLHLLLPSCAAIVHQGGAGTTLTAAVSGVPQLVVPCLPDQLLNITRLAGVGAGACLLRKGRPLDAVRAEATAMLADLIGAPNYRDAAGVLRREIEAQPPPGVAVARIDTLVTAGTPALVGAQR
jgi:UDP:flavonoid glycosyltransferase YjiC (YdhE family)